MGEKHYDVTFTVRGDKLPTIIEALRGEYVHMNITEVASATRAAGRGSNGHSPRHPRHVLTWSLMYKDELFKLMERGREYYVRDPQLIQHFVEQGKAEGFVGNVMSALCRAGALQRVRQGVYARKD